ncbi:nickel import ATP-binding protein NikE, partial [Bacillus haynesii]|nr:nickel import ATP-binding protein NikE [Bacillus haynesii]
WAGLYEKHRFLKSDHPVVKEMKRSILAEHPRFRSIGTRAVQQ